MPNFDDYRSELELLNNTGMMRSLRTLGRGENGLAFVEGTPLVNLCSNDYLSFAEDKNLHAEFYSQMSEANILDGYGLGSASSRLLSGNHPAYEEAERYIGKLYGKPCLLFNSGYHANIGILPALSKKGDLILSDKLNHASIIDGLRLSDANFVRYRHLDYAHLESILEKKRHLYKRVFIVTESIFSMDGDLADLKILAEIKERFDALLYVDEAHALGTRGKNGLGLAEEQNVLEKIDLLVGTFGKAVASAGAFVCCAPVLRDYLINKSRSLIFTTALPPVIPHWIRFVFQKCVEATERRSLLEKKSNRLREAVRNLGFPMPSESNIIPVILGESDKCVSIAEKAMEDELLVLPVRPPTVPKGTSRLRISVCAKTPDPALDKLIACIQNGS
ncbi:8-amino-7-oxononanoate synthase [Fulvitalea axinellae]|uniref:8-amino-7-oxononanoate synthase n=1 Tax=Fulvitalea axinellae TaxID=1182444 RepID=A0AAU9D106_9BACT|nr:8-amino-7-oxononanoate synthase [Fulvitalea axinellae]